MPCMDGPTAEDDARMAQERADVNARVACEVLRLLTSAQIGRLSQEAQQWWAEHLIADRQREEREAEALRHEMLKRAGLAKLSDDEREALGLGRRR